MFLVNQTDLRPDMMSDTTPIVKGKNLDKRENNLHERSFHEKVDNLLEPF